MSENITKGMININVQIEVLNQLKREKSAKIPSKLSNRIDTFFGAVSEIRSKTVSNVVRGAQYYEYLGEPTNTEITVVDRNSETGKKTFTTIQSVITYGDSVIKELTSLK